MKIKAIKISQPLADFFITKIKAKDLLNISFSEQLEYIDEEGNLKGSQRKIKTDRLKEIGKYIDSVELAFPNAIILAANYTPEGELVGEKKVSWKIEKIDEGIYEIDLPSNKKLAAVIDGQHRLQSFHFANNPERMDVELLCSVFFDLPNSYQAYLFATINGNQKKVDKSLALEQFGFNVKDEPRKSWTPEKLAVFISRKLNFSQQLDSAFYNRIKLAPIHNFDYNSNKDNWQVSTATIVDGILSLISSNPKRDRVEMGREHIFKNRSRDMVKDITDKSPLRDLFLKVKDDELIAIIKQYFDEVNQILWEKASSNSYVFKTIGIHALFDLLKRILIEKNRDEIDTFSEWLLPVKNVDFGANYFQASGVGKSRIRKTLFYANKFNVKLKPEDIENINNLLDGD